jgi:hypothetical protein
MIRVKCRTLFDITATGVVGHFKSSRVPFRDRAGQNIQNEIDWNRARNQQRNWETLTQLISLRTQIIDVVGPQKIDSEWEFEFGSETPDVYGTPDDPVSVLREDSNGVPMIITLTTGDILATELITQGPDQNVWFNTMPINTTLEN